MREHAVTIKEGIPLLKDTLNAGLVPSLLASPGVGKSDIIRQIANKANLQVIDFRLSQADPTDLNGFPTLNADRSRSHYAPPETFPLEMDALPKNPDGTDKNGWLLFFDEMTSAAPSVQAAAYKVILDRMVGERKIHDKVFMACAGNLLTDKAVVNKLSTAMQSRMIHFNLEADVPSWIEWADSEGIDFRVKSFIQFRPELLHKFDPKHVDNTFPCPRTWEFMSRLVSNMATIPYDKLPLLAGCVGSGAAIEFREYTEIFQSLPTIQEIISSPDKVPVSDEPGTLYAITGLLSKNADKNNLVSIMEYASRLPMEFQVITLQGIVRKDITLKAEKPVLDWLMLNAEELA